MVLRIVIGLLVLLVLFYLIYWRPNRKIISYKGKLLGRINVIRNKNHLSPLGRVKLLDKLAATHSKTMAKYKTCTHIGIKKRRSVLLRKAGLSGVGENVCHYPAKSYTERVIHNLVRGWMRSPEHRANILNPDYKRTGIGIAYRRGYIYATQLFSN